MNNNEFNNRSSSKKETYHATTNLNIDIENPQINMSNVVGVNIKDVDNSNFTNDRFSDTRVNNNESYASFDMTSNDNNISTYQNVPNFKEGFPSSDPIKNIKDSYGPSISHDFEVDSKLNVGVTNNMDVSTESSQFIPNISDSKLKESSISSFTETVDTSISKPVYEPTLEEKKQKGLKFSVSSELKITIFIIFVLFIFILLMPYIYDFFKNLQLALAR